MFCSYSGSNELYFCQNKIAKILKHDSTHNFKTQKEANRSKRPQLHNMVSIENIWLGQGARLKSYTAHIGRNAKYFQ
jgi:hypothetical protein